MVAKIQWQTDLIKGRYETTLWEGASEGLVVTDEDSKDTLWGKEGKLTEGSQDRVFMGRFNAWLSRLRSILELNAIPEDEWPEWLGRQRARRGKGWEDGKEEDIQAQRVRQQEARAAIQRERRERKALDVEGNAKKIFEQMKAEATERGEFPPKKLKKGDKEVGKDWVTLMGLETEGNQLVKMLSEGPPADAGNSKRWFRRLQMMGLHPDKWPQAAKEAFAADESRYGFPQDWLKRANSAWDDYIGASSSSSKAVKRTNVTQLLQEFLSEREKVLAQRKKMSKAEPESSRKRREETMLKLMMDEAQAEAQERVERRKELMEMRAEGKKRRAEQRERKEEKKRKKEARERAKAKRQRQLNNAANPGSEETMSSGGKSSSSGGEEEQEGGSGSGEKSGEGGSDSATDGL